MAIPKEIPIFGQPVYIITESRLEDKVQMAGKGGYLGTLTYFAVNAILVSSLNWADETFTKVIINRDMVAEDGKTSLELRMDLTKPSEDAVGVFINEAKAQEIAKKMNIAQKGKCSELLDIATKAFNKYDDIIAACAVK